jgi:hypothetical protein
VSLEAMGDYLPDDSSNPSPKLPSGTTTVRLICYRTWRFTGAKGLSRCRGMGVLRGRRVEPAWALIAGPV